MAEIEPVDDAHAGFPCLLPVQAAGVLLPGAPRELVSWIVNGRVEPQAARNPDACLRGWSTRLRGADLGLNR